VSKGVLIFWAAIAAVALIGILIKLAHDRQMRSAAALSGDLEWLQAELLDSVKEASANRGTFVTLERFWWSVQKQVKLTNAQRTQVIMALVEKRHLYLPPEDRSDPVMYGLRALGRYVFCIPPRGVILTDRTWELMIHGASGSIVIGTVTNMNYQSVNTGGGNAVNTTMAGRDVSVRAGDVKSRASSSGLSSDDLIALATALRADARSFTDADAKAEVRALADKVEDEAAAAQPDDDRVVGMVQRAIKYASQFGDAMNATSKLVEAWQGIEGHL
jgi:hypothetical protein